MKRMGGVLFALLLALGLTLSAAALGGDVDVGGGDSGGYSGGGGDSYIDSLGRSGGSGSRIPYIVILAIFGIPFLHGVLERSGEGRKRRRTDRKTLDELRLADPAFREEEIAAEVSRWVQRFEDAWCAGDMTPERDFIGQSLFLTYQNQLRDLQERNEAWRSEDLKVLACEPTRYKRTGGEDRLEVYIKEQKRVWVVRADDREQAVKGNPFMPYVLEYRWTLSRPTVEGRGERTGRFGHRAGGWVLEQVNKLSQSDLVGG